MRLVPNGPITYCYHVANVPAPAVILPRVVGAPGVGFIVNL